jgi:hypothetical protein
MSGQGYSEKKTAQRGGNIDKDKFHCIDFDYCIRLFFIDYYLHGLYSSNDIHVFKLHDRLAKKIRICISFFSFVLVRSGI